MWLPRAGRPGPGPVAVVSHSGSVFSALLHNRRGLRFNLVVSAGNELVTSAAAYLDHALELPGTRVVALFLETVREPAAFRAALAKAAARAIPVVALKVGRGQAARPWSPPTPAPWPATTAPTRPCSTPTGSPRWPPWTSWPTPASCWPGAGPPRRAGRHPRLGGERAHLLDVAEQLRVPLAGISAATRERLAAVLEPGLPATNPLDAWGTGNHADQIFATCIQALLDDPATAALALNLDLTTEPTPETGYTGLAVDAAASTTKPVAVIANLTSAADPGDAATLRAAGIPVLEGTATGLAAFGHLLAYRDFLAHGGAVDNPAPPAPGSATLPSGLAAVGSRRRARRRPGTDLGCGRPERWRARLGDPGRPLDEAEGLALLGDWGCRWWRPRWRPWRGGGRGRAGRPAGGAEDGRARGPTSRRWTGSGLGWTGRTAGRRLRRPGRPAGAAGAGRGHGRPGGGAGPRGGRRPAVRAPGDGGRRRGAGRGPPRPPLRPPPVDRRRAWPCSTAWPSVPCSTASAAPPGRPGRGRRGRRQPLRPGPRPRHRLAALDEPAAGRPGRLRRGRRPGGRGGLP